MQTQYIAAYDLENLKTGLASAEKIVEIHRRYSIPATFFIVGMLLEKEPGRFRAALDDPLFDLQSHSYSHKLLRDSRMHGPGCSLEELKEEVERGKKTVEDTFGRACTGLRSGFGFCGGMRGAAERLRIFSDAGLRFISTDLRGPGDSLPALLQQPYRYDEDGFGNLWEIPAHGWHDNVLKWGFKDHPTIAWPLPEPWIVPDKVPKTPEEEFEVHRRWIDKAVERSLQFVSLCLHPWSVCAFHPEAKTAELLLSYVRRIGLPTTTYSKFSEQLSQERASDADTGN